MSQTFDEVLLFVPCSSRSTNSVRLILRPPPGIKFPQHFCSTKSDHDPGINLIDTAPLYGESEKYIGIALSQLDISTRESLVLCSKVGDAGPQNGGHHPFSEAGVRASVEGTLQNLGVEKIDLVLLHDPTAAELEFFLNQAPVPSEGGTTVPAGTAAGTGGGIDLRRCRPLLVKKCWHHKCVFY